ncbi:MAG: hypothetical protein ABUK11_01240 [Mariprofundaceae bacterium]
MYKLDIYPEEALVVLMFSGQLEIEEIETAIHEMASHSDYIKHFDGVSDCRSAKVMFSEKQLHQFNRKAKENGIARGVWCLLVDRPLETAMAMIYAHEIKENHPVAVFSTVKAASEYLNKDINYYLSRS